MNAHTGSASPRELHSPPQRRDSFRRVPPAAPGYQGKFIVIGGKINAIAYEFRRQHDEQRTELTHAGLPCVHTEPAVTAPEIQAHSQ